MHSNCIVCLQVFSQHTSKLRVSNNKLSINNIIISYNLCRYNESTSFLIINAFLVNTHKHDVLSEVMRRLVVIIIIFKLYFLAQRNLAGYILNTSTSIPFTIYKRTKFQITSNKYRRIIHQVILNVCTCIIRSHSLLIIDCLTICVSSLFKANTDTNHAIAFFVELISICPRDSLCVGLARSCISFKKINILLRHAIQININTLLVIIHATKIYISKILTSLGWLRSIKLFLIYAIYKTLYLKRSLGLLKFKNSCHKNILLLSIILYCHIINNNDCLNLYPKINICRLYLRPNLMLSHVHI